MKPRYFADTPGKFLRPLTRLCFLILGRLALLALLRVLGICLPSLWSLSFPLHAPALIPLPRQGAAFAYLDSLSPYDLVVKTDGSVSFLFDKSCSGVLANCSPCGSPSVSPKKRRSLCVGQTGSATRALCKPL